MRLYGSICPIYNREAMMTAVDAVASIPAMPQE